MNSRFTVLYDPVPQPRARFRAIPNPNSKKGAYMAVAYEDRSHPIHLWKIRVLDAWRTVMPSPGFRYEGPLAVELLFFMPRPQAKVWKTKPMPRELDTRRTGDIDNLAKGVLDALNHKAWEDDAQVVKLTAEKWMASGEEAPRCDITITQAEAQPLAGLALDEPPPPREDTNRSERP